MKNKLFALSDVYNTEKISLENTDNVELLLGGIMLNRIVGIAYDNLELSTVPAEVIKVLKIVKKNNERITDDFICNVCYLADVLKNVPFKYALLKGSYLTPMLYKRGQRTSNDIDILIEGKDVSLLEKILVQNGFVQGHVNENNEIVPASRREIIHSKLNNGETIPFVKFNNGIKLEIDINFSVDFKPDNSKIVPRLLSETIPVNLNGHIFYTLNMVDFLIHLCCHLYKEATTYDWLNYRRDLMLYKFSDINVMLHEYGDKEFYRGLDQRIREFDVKKECYYTLYNSTEIYPFLKEDILLTEMLERIRPVDLKFMKQIVYPYKRKKFVYDMTFTQWFFCENRIGNLIEVTENG